MAKKTAQKKIPNTRGESGSQLSWATLMQIVLKYIRLVTSGNESCKVAWSSSIVFLLLSQTRLPLRWSWTAIAIQWKDNWVKWRVTIKMIELLAFINVAFYERKWIDKFCSCNSNHQGWKAVHSQNNCRGKAFNLYNWHFNMDTIFKSLEGISRVLLATNFKNLLKETGNFVMFNNFKK